MSAEKDERDAARGERPAELPDQVRRKVEKKLEARESEKKGLWYGLGMFGLVGWAVALPTVAFVALGVWLDRALDDDYSWTLAMLLAGIFVGCLNAWYWVKKESQTD